MKNDYYPPTYKESQFHCPMCNVFAKQEWGKTYPFIASHGSLSPIHGLEWCKCSHCNKRHIWYEEKLLIPDATTAPPPHQDLPESIRPDYLEAGSILNKSPRGSAALLRLCVQKLMVELGELGENINKDIASLVNKGLPEEVQQALDILRVIGNNAVHPGEIDLQDDHETAKQLFELINFIIEERITRRKRISALYIKKIPQKTREHISQRDSK